MLCCVVLCYNCGDVALHFCGVSCCAEWLSCVKPHDCNIIRHSALLCCVHNLPFHNVHRNIEGGRSRMCQMLTMWADHALQVMECCDVVEGWNVQIGGQARTGI